ncbi:hypothetical protein C2869_04175 [Saccharobesus litoralis]|uniref:Agarase n=1 Tax=Saccharobesus litoralis TaxID=2172099 RepID=A0A2S0VN93_9ALTE|nr:hypothetical protein [Saccharobesus litoralis]AWB65683.1 hypothetical protein C2869_04175 [Saccharobesus litoralis]
MKIKTLALTIASLLSANAVNAANIDVDVNLDMVHSVGGEQDFSREKYIRFHGSLSSQQWPTINQRDAFFEDQDIHVGRATGSLSYVAANVDENPSFPGYVDPNDLDSYAAGFKANFNSWSHANKHRATYQTVGIQKKRFPGNQLNGWNMGLNNYDALAKYYQHYLTKFFDNNVNKPTFLEVVNEPLFMLDPNNADYLPGLTREKIWEGHAKVAQKLQASHPDVKVGGYTTALPRWWRNDFADWDLNMKAFMDTAGADMDFFSLHLYDLTSREDDQFLRGSQNEAILDLIEAYTHIKKLENPGVAGWQTEKPFLVSEYGTLGKDHLFKSQLEADWENMAAFNGMLLQLLERPNKILAATPFILHYDQTRLLNDDGTFTRKLDFYKLWKKVEGTRVDTWSADPDVQVDAYVKNNKAYVIVNNLENELVTVDVNLFNGKPVSNVKMRRLYSNANNEPLYQEDIPVGANTSKNIPANGTMILEYTFSQNLNLNHTSKETKYYSTKYLQPIAAANTNISFPVKNLNLATNNGEAVLRIGVNREHGKPVVPDRVFINGKEVNVLPSDWKGYDQSTWNQFFGLIEVPINYADLQAANNTVQLRYAQTGGTVSSVAIQVFEQSRNVTR